MMGISSSLRTIRRFASIWFHYQTRLEGVPHSVVSPLLIAITLPILFVVLVSFFFVFCVVLARALNLLCMVGLVPELTVSILLFFVRQIILPTPLLF